MAQKIVLIDDIDESEAAETIHYTVDGQEYEIDLSEQHAEKFRAALAPFLEKSRMIEREVFVPSRSTTRRRSSGNSRDDLGEIRAWAKAQGLEVSPRGRIKKEIMDRYDAEHKSRAT